MNTKMTILASALILTGCGSIDSGHVGVRTGFTGKVNTKEMGQQFYFAVTSTVEEYSCKQISVDLMDMTPKVADNLFLKDFDLEIYYQPTCNQVAEIKLQFTGKDGWDDDLGLPGYFLVRSMGREIAYKAAAKYDSLEIHKNRKPLSTEITQNLNSRLEEEMPGAFLITNVVVRSIVTDPSIEESIRIAVSKNNELKAKKKEVEIAQQQAIAYKELQSSLTPEVLKNKELDIMEKAIIEGANPYVIFGMNNATPLIQMPNK